MTNASIKNLLFGLSVVAIAAALSLGAFATTASASEDGGWSDFGGSWSDFGGYDGWSDYGGYDGWGDSGGYDNWSDYGGYDNWSDYGGYDNWSDYGGYNDYETYNNDYETYNNDYETYGNDYETYNNDYETYNNDYETYNNDYETYNEEYQEVYEEYFQQEQQYQQQSFAQQQYQQAMQHVPPQYRPQMPTFPQTPHYPAPVPPRPQPPMPQPPVPPTPHYPRPQPQPPVIVPPPVHNTNTNTNINTCVGTNNCNTNTNVSTIHGSFNTAVVTTPTPQPIIQYQYPTYIPTYTQSQAPYCVITISQGANGTVFLTWSSQYATSAYITPSVGQVAPNGSTSLYAYGNSVYSLTVYGPGGSYVCRTQTFVNPVGPTSPYVSLTQIPYTGLALGPIGNAIYWMSLMSLAVAGAYLLVYYKGGALALAGQALAGSMKFRSEVDPVDAAEASIEETIVEAPVASPVQISNLPTQSSTRDAIRITRDANGQPRLVISRS